MPPVFGSAVNAHTHLYSGLVPLGMPPCEPPPPDFLAILDRIWWRLDRALDLIADGERSSAVLHQEMAAVVAAEPLANLDYAAAVDAATLEELEHLVGEIRLVVAAQIGRPRLLDNVGATL